MYVDTVIRIYNKLNIMKYACHHNMFGKAAVLTD